MLRRERHTGSGDVFVARICAASQCCRGALSIRDASLSCGPAHARVRVPIAYCVLVAPAYRCANHQILMGAEEGRLYMTTVIE